MYTLGIQHGHLILTQCSGKRSRSIRLGAQGRHRLSPERSCLASGERRTWPCTPGLWEGRWGSKGRGRQVALVELAAPQTPAGPTAGEADAFSWASGSACGGPPSSEESGASGPARSPKRNDIFEKERIQRGLRILKEEDNVISHYLDFQNVHKFIINQ